MREAAMNARIKLAVLADWLRGWDYEVSGPGEDDREVMVTIDSMGGVHLTAPPEVME
jgi:hypothetical protein